MGIEDLENKYSHLSSLFVRADNNLKKYKVATVPFQERISSLETLNSAQKKSIDKLKKRVERRDATIKRLKGTADAMHMPSLTNTPSTASSDFMNLGYKRHPNALMVPVPVNQTRMSDDDNVSIIGSFTSN